MGRRQYDISFRAVIEQVTNFSVLGNPAAARFQVGEFRRQTDQIFCLGQVQAAEIGNAGDLLPGKGIPAARK